MCQIHKLIREAEKAQYPVQEEGKELKHGKWSYVFWDFLP